MYGFALVLNVVLMALAIGPGIGSGLTLFPAFLQNLAWRHPAFFGEAWSLAVEEWFYLLLPLLVLAAKRFKLPDRTGLVYLAMFLLVGSSAVRFVVATSGGAWDEDIRKVVLCRLDAPLFGVIAAWISIHWAQDRIARRALWVTGLVLLALSCWLSLMPAPWRDSSLIARVALFPITNAGFACLILAGLSLQVAKGWFSTACSAVARWSYSAYLLHYPVILLLRHLVGTRAQEPAWAMTLLLTFPLVALAASAMTYRFVERPILAWRDRNIVTN